jgi:RNA polymerase sigma factor (sigma-70 family)
MTMVAANGQEHVAGMVSQAIAGDEVAFARIVAAHQDDLSRVAYVVTHDGDLAQEAVQEAWAICWRELPRLRDPERLRPWLVAICANQARQLVRRARRRSVVEFDVAGAQDRASDSRDWARDVDLRNALARLNPDDRALLALRYVAGLDSFELAHFVGLSPSGTRARLARLLASLRKELDHD